MTAFDYFQEATCDIGSGNRAAAIANIDAALSQIDKDGIDADLRADLYDLRETLLANCAG